MAVLLLGRDIPEKLKSPMMFNTYSDLSSMKSLMAVIISLNWEKVEFGGLYATTNNALFGIWGHLKGQERGYHPMELENLLLFFYDNVIFSCLLKKLLYRFFRYSFHNIYTYWINWYSTNHKLSFEYNDDYLWVTLEFRVYDVMMTSSLEKSKKTQLIFRKVCNVVKHRKTTR